MLSEIRYYSGLAFFMAHILVTLVLLWSTFGCDSRVFYPLNPLIGGHKKLPLRTWTELIAFGG